MGNIKRENMGEEESKDTVWGYCNCKSSFLPYFPICLLSL